ncbi:hypothetical protein BGZ52_009724 [Haplosporangium bisporale]|nr:hypothetical protein BGZ52_009724 [Haplosporangium bisporale]KAF9213354.1 hypothetical protein BGZ59_005500 [Podila verticillata]KFH68600.1 hypothetical protein MVEG_05410 [Podila verticillata NRRL 6337]
MQSIGHDLRRGLNNINPLGNNYKTINKWLAEMKNIDSSLKTLDKEISADAKLIATWGTTEGDDLTDVCQRMAQLMEEVGLVQQTFSLRHTAYRKTIKSIKTQEMTLDENRKKKHDLTGQIAKVQKSSKENPIKLMELQNALDRVSAELLTQELELMQFKRINIRDAFNAKFDAMIEYSEKMALIAGYGRQITQAIDTETQVADRLRIYSGAEFTALTVNQVKTAVTNWQAPAVGDPVRSHVAPSMDELALSAAASAYNRTPPMDHALHAATVQATSYADNHERPRSYGRSSGEEVSALPPASAAHATDAPGSSDEGASEGYAGPPTLHRQQMSHLQEQQRQLELEQQRLYQQNLASLSPSPSQQHYQSAGSPNSSGGMGGFTSVPPRRSDTQELYPPQPPGGYDSGSNGSPGYGGQYQSQYGQYDNATYQSVSPAGARPYPLGFVNPRDRDQMEADRHKAEIQLPPLHFSQSPILHEK